MKYDAERKANANGAQNHSGRNDHYDANLLRPDDGHTNASFSASRSSVVVACESVQLQLVPTVNDNHVAEQGNGELQAKENGQRKAKYGPPGPELYQQYPAGSERVRWMALSIFVPFMFAGFGMVLAGIVLDEVQHWTVFKEVDELFVMIPALLGLKGNLEMTSASRLSTAANIGQMNNRLAWFLMASGSIAITQAQSIVVGLLAGVVAIPLTFIQEMSTASFRWKNCALMLCSGVVTSSVASLFLDTTIILLVTVCHRCNVNPDNVALPIAASLGDVGTLALLSVIANGLWNMSDSHFWVMPTVTCVLLSLLPVWLAYARRNWFVRQVCADGWVPVISAMLISSAGGAIMKDVVYDFEYIAMYQPMMNGVGGNLAGVQASRLSTRLHQLFERPGSFDWRQVPNANTNSDANTDTNAEATEPKSVQVTSAKKDKSRLRCDSGDVREIGDFLDPLDQGLILRKGCPNPAVTFCSRSNVARTSQLLIALLIPGEMTFVYIIFAIHTGLVYTATFVLTLLAASLLHLLVLLYVTHWIIQLLWRIGRDPDNFAVPYITALGDIFGSALVAACFWLMRSIQDPMSIPNKATISNSTSPLEEYNWNFTLFPNTTHLL